jgi:hypothetical protein
MKKPTPGASANRYEAVKPVAPRDVEFQTRNDSGYRPLIQDISAVATANFHFKNWGPYSLQLGRVSFPVT